MAKTVRSSRSRLPVGAIGLLLTAICVGFVFRDDAFILHVGITVLIYASLATSLNLLMGYSGQVSFAHAAFYGIGAYTGAILATRLGWPFLPALMVAVIVSLISSLAIGLPSLRLGGTYLAVMSMGLQLIIQTLILKWVFLTRGPMGILGIPKPSFWGMDMRSNGSLFFLLLIWLIVNLLILWRFEASRLGFEMLAMREDEDAAKAAGINTVSIKVTAFCVACGLAGGTGVFYAHYMGTISPEPFQINFSAILVAMVLLGGRGTIAGPLIGAILLTLLPEVMDELYEIRTMFCGFIMILIVAYVPNGLMSLTKAIPILRKLG